MSKTSSINTAVQGNILCIHPKSAKYIIDTCIRRMSVCECPGDSLDLKPIQEDLNIMNMSSET